MAKSQIKRMHRRAKIIRAFGSRKGWQIFKTPLGKPLYRDKSGYVLFKLPGEKWCQLRYFRITERYKGGGRYLKARATKIGFVRFQSGR